MYKKNRDEQSCSCTELNIYDFSSLMKNRISNILLMIVSGLLILTSLRMQYLDKKIETQENKIIELQNDLDASNERVKELEKVSEISKDEDLEKIKDKLTDAYNKITDLYNKYGKPSIDEIVKSIKEK